MPHHILTKITLISGVVIASTNLAITVNASPITPAADGTGTQVNQQGQTINITGGQRSSDGGNLFHSFDQFGVNTGQTANFQSSPDINNILGRVSGGNASIINGLLQITGGNSNLFLMNPAGIVFGPNASLNVPADFTATTATGIGFGNNNWFNSVGDNNWADLVGNPSHFALDFSQPGWVVNFADLTLDSGHNLTLLGGGVLNSGNLTVPGGNISIAAVPGESIVRISQPGNLLSLDISNPADNSGLNPTTITPLSLPQLLTGGDAILDATQVQHNADGTITLTSSGVTIDPTTDTGLGLAAGEVNVAAETGGQVNVLANSGNIILDQVDSDTVNVNANGGNITQVNSDSLINASAVQLQTEGEGGIGSETEPLRLEADNLEATAGSGGAFFEVPNGDVTVGSVTDELTGISTVNGGDVSLEAVGNITVTEGISSAPYPDEVGVPNGDVTVGGVTDELTGISTVDSTNFSLIVAGHITVASMTGIPSVVYPEVDGGDITLTSQNGAINFGDYGMINSSSSGGDGGSIALTAGGDIQVSDISSYGSDEGGDITLTSQSGAINFGDYGMINSSSSGGYGGSVDLEAVGNLSVTNINSSGSKSGGNITLTSIGGDIISIDTSGTYYGSEDRNLNASSDEGTAGNITLSARNSIITGNITADGFQQGGNINLTTYWGEIDTSAGDIDAGSENGVDGNIEINAGRGSVIVGELNGPENISVTNGGTDNIWVDDPPLSATADADTVNSQSGQVSIQAHNDITVNEAIVADSIESLELQAGRNININADIDTSGNNGDITLQANHNGADPNRRQAGTGNITMAPGTTLDAGNGNILLQLGTLAEVGEITLANLNTTGTVTFINPGGNILSAGANSLINASAGIFQNNRSGGIGSETAPININLNNLEASAGSGGAFFNSPNSGVTVGDATDSGSGIFTSGGGEVSLTAVGNITVSEDISTFVGSEDAGNITLTSNNGAIDTTKSSLRSASQGNAGSINLAAEGDIVTNNILSYSGSAIAGSITLTSNSGAIDTTNGRLGTWSGEGKAGDVRLTAAGDLRTGSISSYGATGGDITLESGGAIDTTGGDFASIDTWSGEGKAGDVRLTAAGDIRTGSISSYGATGGDITLESNKGGAIDTTRAELNSSSEYGDGGSVVLRTAGEIRTGDIFSLSGVQIDYDSWSNWDDGYRLVSIPNSTGNAGNITLESTNSTIDTSAGILDSRSSGGSAGDIKMDAQGNISTGFVVSSAVSAASSQGGDITISSHDGAINTTVGNLTGDLTDEEVLPRDFYYYSFRERPTEAEIAANSDISSAEAASIFENNWANLEAYSRGGKGGNVILSAAGDIITSHISAFGHQGSGKIDITSNNGAINTGAIFSFSQAGNAGNVTLNAANDIKTSHVSASANQQGGNITIESGGSFDIDAATIHSFSQAGNAGDVQITTSGNTTLGGDANRHAIRSAGQTEGGDITIRSYGNIDTNAGDLETYSETGIGGDVYLHADASVTTQNISTFGPIESGDITIISGESSVNTATLETIATNGTSGNIQINSYGREGNIETANLTSSGEDGSGNITVQAEDGSVITENVTTVSENGSSGNITLRANNDIQAVNITSIGAEDSGNISVTSETGSITTANLETVAVTGNSGEIDLTATQDITTGKLRSIAGNNSGDISATSTEGAITTGEIETIANQGISGDVTLNAQEDINTGKITSTGAIASGDITLNSAEGIVNTGELYTDTGEIKINQGGQDYSEQISERHNSLAPYIFAAKLPFNAILTLNPEDTQVSISNNSQGNVQQVLGNIQVLTSNYLQIPLEDRITSLEESRSSEFAEYLGLSLEDQVSTTASARNVLETIAEQTGTESAVVYVTAYEDQLELILFTADGAPIRATVPEANREALMQEVQKFREEITHPLKRRGDSYLAPAQQLYQWLIAPIETQLQAGNIDTLLFSMDAGLRGLPMAALHDGQQFLVEKYSLSLIPSISLMDSRYKSLQGTEVLAMGADKFPDMSALPGVGLELDLITQQLWPGTQLLNQEFTPENLQEQRENNRYDIVHLATHADFSSGRDNSSFIYFWNDKLPLDDLRHLGLNNPPVELLVLSACRTAVGDEIAELGFAGLAVQNGVKSALASIWYVDDTATLGLMMEFYKSLNSAPIKSEALRQAQISMIHNQVQISSNQLPVSKEVNGTSLPPELVRLQNMNLSHPYYWSGFTMIGSPW